MMDTPLIVAIVGVCGIALGSFVTLISTQKAAQKQIDAQVTENKARRQHEARMALRKECRDATAHLIPALDIAIDRRMAAIAAQIAMLKDREVPLLRERHELATEAKRHADAEVPYWACLVPPSLRGAAQEVLHAGDAIVSELYERLFESDDQSKQIDARRRERLALEAHRKRRSEFVEAAHKWLDENAEA